MMANASAIKASEGLAKGGVGMQGTGGVADWLAGWLACLLTWSVGRLADCLTGWSAGGKLKAAARGAAGALHSNLIGAREPRELITPLC